MRGSGGFGMLNLSPPFNMQRQRQSQWCWSAVATSTASFYNPNTPHTQCSVVNAILQLPICCCQNGSDIQCDVAHRLDQALQYVGHLRGRKLGAPTWTELNREIRNNRPVGVQISLLGGGAHFVAITGTYRNQGITVADPKEQRTTTTKLKSFAKTDHGDWRETYFTSP